jgi:signal transduction histidine kinase
MVVTVQNVSQSESQTLINAFFQEHTVLKTLLKDFHDGVLIIDRGACVVQLNSSLKKLWKLDDEVVGQSVKCVLKEDSPFHPCLEEALNDGSARVIEISWRGQGGRLYFETHLIPIWISKVKADEELSKRSSANLSNLTPSLVKDVSLAPSTSNSSSSQTTQDFNIPDGCVAIFHNITERRRTEKMRRDFVANVSHELRTPLSAIRGYSETILEDDLLDGEAQNLAISRDFVKVIHRHAIRLGQLVEDLLDLSKLESPDYQPDLSPLSPEELIRQAIAHVEDKAEDKGIELSSQIPEKALPAVLAEANSMQQVLVNLLDNAIKYTPTGGKVIISAELQKSSSKVSKANQVEIKVADNGIGIESKYLSRIFERFYRVDKARSRDLGGTGLGLAIVKHIVQLHGGEIKVESAVNKGSVFRFSLKTQT